MEKLISSQPPQYIILECLGEGLNSCVYKALRKDRKTSVEQLVAIKILKSKNLVDIWRSELNDLVQLKAPNVVSLFGWDWIGDRPALILEYIDGLSLHQLVRETALSAGDIAEICRQIEMGLTQLSVEGLLHGDLSLSNVLVSRRGQVKLIDFGYVHKLEGEIMVTPDFAHPDILRGIKPSLQSDRYSLNKIRDHLLRRSGLSPNQNAASNSGGHQQALSQKVQEVLNSTGEGSARTTKLPIKSCVKPKTSRVSRWSVKLSLLLATLFLNQADTEVGNARSVRQAIVMVRTQKWVKVWVDGKDWGYSPLQIRLPISASYQVKWRAQRATGTRTLTIGRAETIVLTDSFFE